MSKKNRVTALVLVSVMLLALIGCTPATTNPTNAPTSAAGSAATAAPGGGGTTAPAATDVATADKEHYDISIWFRMHPSDALTDIPTDGYATDHWYEEKFNVTLDYQYVPDASSTEVFNVMIASGDIPDVVKQDNWSILNQYQEAWAVLNDYIIGKYENLESTFINDDYVFALSANEDGGLRIICTLTEQIMGDVLLVRGDIVEKWNLDMTQYKTKEDYHELLLFMQANEPTLTPYMTRMQRGGLTQRLCEGWSGIKEAWFEEDGEIKFGGTDPRLKEVVEYLRVLYSEKLIDQTYPSTDTAAWSEVLLGENTGIFMTHDQAASRIKWSIEQWAALGVTDKYYVAIPPLQPDENTKGFTTIHFPKQRKSYAVYRDVDPGKIDRIMEIWDFNFSEEGFMFTGFGVEGVNYYINDAGLPRPLESYTQGVADGTIPESERFGGKTKDGPHTEFNAIFETDIQQIADARVLYEDGGLIKKNMLEPCRFTDEENSTYTKLYADIQTYMNENLDKFIMGIQPMEQWDAFVTELDVMGIQTLIDIYNAAYQRAQALLN